ncbi:hypothetical protein [Glaciecola sp. SC05]|uniref:hypothetical protein n=1 Tax=Glaciecola sp. SC05 TaxID=1987355 RepID=UPI003528CB33
MKSLPLNILVCALLTTLMLVTPPSSIAQMSEYTKTQLKSMQQVVGSYTGTVSLNQPIDVELTLWFNEKGLVKMASIGGFISIGNEGCVFGLRGGTAYLGEHTQQTMKKFNLPTLHNKEPVLTSMQAELVGSAQACVNVGLLERRKKLSISMFIVSGDAQNLSLVVSRNNFKTRKADYKSGIAKRAKMSERMQGYLQKFIPNETARIDKPPHYLELALLNDPIKTLSFEEAVSVFPRNCGQLFTQTKTALATNDIEAVAAFKAEETQYLRIKKISDAGYSEHKVAQSDQNLLNEEQWHNLNISSEHEYIGNKACAIVDAYIAANSLGLINKYLQISVPPIDNKWLISKQKDIFIVEATGIDVIRAVKHRTQAQQSIRLYGDQSLFTVDDESRTIMWLDKTQKAFTASKYKDYHKGDVFIDVSEQVEAFFEPALGASQRIGAAVLTLAATFPQNYTVCPRLLGEFGRATCVEHAPSVKANQIFITHSEQAAISLFKELAPNASLVTPQPRVRAYSEKCITEDFCNFPAASFIIPIYENSYSSFTKSNAQYTQQIGERYKDHIFLTNTILKEMGFKTAKDNQLNLFPYFAEYYLHLFEQKYPSCSRELRKISIRSDTKAYSIVDGLGNTVEKHDSVALYSDYQIPQPLVSMCNEICGQTGPSRKLSNIANMMSHPSMVQILQGLEQTMETFSCDSPQIMQLEKGMLGIYDKQKESRDQEPFLERSSFL